MTQKPNLLFLMPDQLRPDFLSCYGADFIATPHIDSLAEQGVCYERAYSVSPICVPARAMLLTGLNALKNGVTDNGQWLRPDLAACGIKTWPEMLNEQGYYTAAIGKMHFYPWDINHGFQYRVAAEDKRWIYVQNDPQEQHNLLNDRQYWDKYLELDALLTQAIMHAMTASHYDKLVYIRSLSGDPAFGKEGWQRPYPQPLGGPT